jgi:hypothetical protein
VVVLEQPQATTAPPAPQYHSGMIVTPGQLPTLYNIAPNGGASYPPRTIIDKPRRIFDNDWRPGYRDKTFARRS